MSEINLSNTSEIDAAWQKHFENMLNAGTAAPAEAAESMLRIAALISEGVLGPQKTAATLTLAAMFFVERISGNDRANSRTQH